jgi:fatty acid/phospholipid biosynthesis enzyme
MDGEVNVIVSDGFTGNVALKNCGGNSKLYNK